MRPPTDIDFDNKQHLTKLYKLILHLTSHLEMAIALKRRCPSDTALVRAVLSAHIANP